MSLANLNLMRTVIQVKLPNGARVGSLCPFCKAEFSVNFRGPRSLAEKEAVQAEEQRIVEATLRARQVRPIALVYEPQVLI